MEHALQLDVPLKVDSNYGSTWYDAKIERGIRNARITRG